MNNMDFKIKEEWRPVAIEPFQDKYEVSTLGKIRNLKRFSILKPDIDPAGYASVVLYDVTSKRKRYTTKVHRIVAITFIENPNNLPIVNHKDGDKSNNSIDNLEWVSPRDNNIHRHRIINTQENLQNKISILDEKIRLLQIKRDHLLKIFDNKTNTLL